MAGAFLKLAAREPSVAAEIRGALGRIPPDGETLLQMAWELERTALEATDPVTAETPPPTTPALGSPTMENTSLEDAAPAPGTVDENGALFAEGSTTPLTPGSVEMAQALEAMALALEEGAGWPRGASDSTGRERLLARLEEAVASGLGQDLSEGAPPLHAVRLRVSASAVASVMAHRDPEDALRQRAAGLLAHLVMGEPRRSVRAALAANLCALPDVPEDAGELALEATGELMPKSPPYDAWEPHKDPSEPLLVRHHVYAPEYRQVKDAYEAAGYVRIHERPLQLRRDFPGARSVVVELRRVQAAVVLAEEHAPFEVLILGGLALAVETVKPPGYPRVVMATYRRDPFGVPRLAERFPGDHLVASARGDRPLDDMAMVLALLEGLALREPYALIKVRSRDAAPLLTNRTLWPHEPGALRAAGGAPAPFGSDPAALLEHRMTWALPRSSRRPSDLRWKNDAADTTSYLALEVAVALASAVLHPPEDLPVLEPGGFHEGMPDVDVQTGAALWRVSVTRGLCGQSEEALGALVTLHAHARRAQISLKKSARMSLFLGAMRAAQIATLQCSALDHAREVVHSVLRHAALPAALTMDELLEASRQPAALEKLLATHAKWLEG
ncbi:MAG: hypothetical protein AB2A00_42680 [Myxococcota bacterium]